jgi:hypothetical protein
MLCVYVYLPLLFTESVGRLSSNTVRTCSTTEHVSVSYNYNMADGTADTSATYVRYRNMFGSRSSNFKVIYRAESKIT